MSNKSKERAFEIIKYYVDNCKVKLYNYLYNRPFFGFILQKDLFYEKYTRLDLEKR